MAAFDALLAAADRRDDAAGSPAARDGRAGVHRRAASLRPLPRRPSRPRALRAKVDAKARVCSASAGTRCPRTSPGARSASPRCRHVEVHHAGRLVARHERSPRKGTSTLLLDHYLEALVRKPGALPSSLTLAQARASGAITPAHERFWARARRKEVMPGTRALVEVLLLHRSLPFIAVHAALERSRRFGSIPRSWPSRPAGSPTVGA
jgi:hypothetical protein